MLNCELNEDSGIDSLIVLEVKINIHWVNLCPAVEHGKITRIIPWAMISKRKRLPVFENARPLLISKLLVDGNETRDFKIKLFLVY